MTSVDMVEDLKNLRSVVMNGNWAKVLEIYQEQRELRTAKVTVTGDTILHVAVSCGKRHVVETIVDLVCGERIDEKDENLPLLPPIDENGNEQKLVLEAENDKKNTPLHLAAKMGNVKMCKKICGKDRTLIARHNIAGETPLFLAALHGKREAFLWLHHLYMGSRGASSTDLAHCTRDNCDTILHCAIAQGHIDVAIEIVHLYKDHMKEMIKRNKEGLSPLHLLAASRSAFKSTALPEWPILVRLIYWFLIVKEKNQATTIEELQRGVAIKEILNPLFQESKVASDVNHRKILFKRLSNFIFVRLLPLIYLLDFGAAGITRLLLLFPAFIAAGIGFYKIREMKEAHKWSLQIMNQLLQHASDEDMSPIKPRIRKDNEWECETITIETPLMIAVKNGVMEMMMKIMELFPSTIKDVNVDGKNILLLAVEYKQPEVFRFLCDQKWLSESLFGEEDKEGNNALHVAAKVLNPLQIFWFEYVKESMPNELLERYNKKMEMPEEIFRKNSEELMRREAEWEAKTSEACSVVSILVASLAFATRSSVPGGYDEKGYAILRNNPSPAFTIFIAFEIFALTFSLISTICFLSILASSRPQSVQSWSYSPIKLFAGILSMFISIFGLWISFCAGHFFTLGDDLRKVVDPIYVYLRPSCVIILLVVTQFPTFFFPILFSFLQFASPRRNAIRPIEYRRTTKNEKNGPVLNHQN